MLVRGQEAADAARKQVEQLRAKALEEWRVREAAVVAREAGVAEQEAAIQRRAIQFSDLETENAILKRDLLGLDVQVRKLRYDHRATSQAQGVLAARAQELSERYLEDVEKWVGASISANNYAACRQRLQRVIDWCRSIGFDVPSEREQKLMAKLKADFEMAVREQVEREEQARIKAQIREEQAREREIERELQALEREREAIQAALVKALADAKGAHNAEVERLEARLAEAEQRNQRALSQAQLTKAGHIYIISNLGSFGQNVYKIGMTRRLEPQDRICELSDASVPFSFDVHMMISCDDAPSLERALHQEFHKHRINKVNPRKEFFRVDLEAIRAFVVARRGEVSFVADAEALEYRQSLEMSTEDAETIERAFEVAEKQAGATDVE